MPKKNSWMATSSFFTILLMLQHTMHLLRKAGDYKLLKKAFLKELTFDLAKPAVGIRLTLFNEKQCKKCWRSSGISCS